MFNGRRPTVTVGSGEALHVGRGGDNVVEVHTANVLTESFAIAYLTAPKTEDIMNITIRRMRNKIAFLLGLISSSLALVVAYPHKFVEADNCPTIGTYHWVQYAGVQYTITANNFTPTDIQNLGVSHLSNR